MLVFLGGAGAGLSALVNIFNELDFKDIVVVDKYKSEISEKLEKKGIKVVIGDGVYNFSPQDIVIYSDAVVNSQDFQKIKNNIKFSYFEFVGEISKRLQTISIAGTHGKTSTTSMLISSLVKSNFEKLGLGIVGGFVPDLDNKNYFINLNKKQEIKIIFEKILTPKGSRPTQYFKDLYFVIEADEFNKHFLLLDTYIAGITTVDHDHKDIYPTEEDYFDAFKIFINKTRYKTFTNDENFAKKLNINYVKTNPEIKFDYIFGEHMKKNASLVLEIMQELGINENKALESIKTFKGVWRRQEYLGIIETTISGKNGHNHRGYKIITDNVKQINSKQGITNNENKILIYTDYAHHPVEIQATYNAFRENFPSKKLIGVFQPHQLFRFVSYEKDFLKSLENFNEIFIYDIYSVREDKLIKKLIKEKKLQIKSNKEAIEKIGQEIASKLNGKYIKNFKELIENLKNKSGIAILMTAGDLDYQMRNYLKKARN